MSETTTLAAENVLRLNVGWLDYVLVAIYFVFVLGIGFIARHLHEARCGKVGRLSLPRVSEVLHLEQAARMRAGDPRPIAAPGSSTRKGFELIVQTLQQVIV